MLVIEQAKGINMAHCGWTADQAFDALRRASQRENIKVRELAGMVVAKTVQQAPPPPCTSPPLVSAASGAAAVPNSSGVDACGQQPITGWLCDLALSVPDM